MGHGITGQPPASTCRTVPGTSSDADDARSTAAPPSFEGFLNDRPESAPEWLRCDPDRASFEDGLEQQVAP
jgi:hypothetical protein